jgi:hypothetical protein
MSALFSIDLEAVCPNDSVDFNAVVSMLKSAADEQRSLYDGLEAELRADGAPYLVRFEPGSSLLPRVVAAGWGRSWGIFIDAACSLRDVRAHLRRLLIVTREADQLPMYFRFYDPRVLRSFLPIATPRQEGLFFGPIERFLGDSPGGEAMFVFTRGEAGLAASMVSAR